ncbi:hypothetical protein FNF28_02912 [Cafeteria roenbergensis]|uniref:Plasma membrane ATPase n=1 Tax=Cafeteria roenbergensis TaxID=33653 RepID=A0A5A8DP93_CAFRO|nr:hypothetical protein FNF28_02912 [Cafeteria roenbergensis]
MPEPAAASPTPGAIHVTSEKSTAELPDTEETRIFYSADLEHGLDEKAIETLRDQYGPNELEDDEQNILLKFLSYFWGPMPIMIWVAIIIEIIKTAITGQGFEDFIVLLVLQILNGVVGFIEENNAGNAIAALKDKLAPECKVLRTVGGAVKREKIKSRELVPGDVVELKLGDVVPADCMLVGDPRKETDQLQVDQSALTGESLPKTMYAHDKIKMSSLIKQGEMKAVVVATGKNTFFGKAAGLLKIEDSAGRFHKVLFRITLGLLALSLVLCAIIFTVLVVTAADSAPSIGEESSSTFLRALSIVIVLLVASIPIAMQVVSTSTMAVGARHLASRKVIVARLSAIEELAGMSILCSDKTGTLTKNELTLKPPTLFGDMSKDHLAFVSALAANRASSDMDAIDKVIVESIPQRKEGDSEDCWTHEKLDSYVMEHYAPFNPTVKRTEASLTAPDGSPLRVTKGAPQIVLRMCVDAGNADKALVDRVEAKIQEYADKGFRTLGVATADNALDLDPNWQFQGLLSLFDPPRDDTAETIKAAMASGVDVKMITGDQRAIAVETCRQLEMGTKIFDTEILNSTTTTDAEKSDSIFKANGFAEVLPEHKFIIVQALRERGIVTGMTGDGVNDAPALKRADIGIAVEGATDAAKAAADIVLIEPGLSVIIDAIQQSRKIFQRMRNYAIYRIACTLQLILFFFFAIISVQPATSSFYGAAKIGNAAVPCAVAVNGSVANGLEPFADGTIAPPEGSGLAATPQWWCAHEAAFVLPVISLVVITIINDGTIITIAHDKVIPAGSPQGWDLTEISIVATVLGLSACLGSMLLLVFALQSNQYRYELGGGEVSFFGNLLGDETHHYVTWGQAQTMMYLKVSVSDFLTVFAARTRSFFWERRPGYALATAFSGGINMIMAPLSTNPYAVITIWVYCLIWFVVQDVIKVIAYYVIDNFVNAEATQQARAAAQRAQVSNMMATEEKSRPAKVRTRAASFNTMPTPEETATEMRFKKLEDEIRMLKAILRARGSIAEAEEGEEGTAASAAAAV